MHYLAQLSGTHADKTPTWVVREQTMNRPTLSGDPVTDGLAALVLAGILSCLAYVGWVLWAGWPW